MWSTTFAFQPWHSAVEFKRYLHRFMLEFSRIDTLSGVKRTIYNQYDSLVLPLKTWLEDRAFDFVRGCRSPISITNTPTALHRHRHSPPVAGGGTMVAMGDGDLVFLQNASMTDASSLGSMTNAPAMLTKADSCGWTLWEKLAREAEFGNPRAFNSCIAQSCWESFTVTLQDTGSSTNACSIQRQ